MDKELYSQLYNMREKLKRKFNSNGRTPIVCTDEALSELAKQAPKYKDDMANIEGLGETFVEKYGEYFIVVLNNYHKKHIKTKALKQDVKNTLKNLDNRLVNISKKNRLLYSGKIYNKYAVDLVKNIPEQDDQLAKLLTLKQKKLVLCDKNDDLKTNNENSKDYKKISTLLREVARDYRESGQYDLFIGYPYVIGKTYDEDFNVRAPLVLFPILVEKTNDRITISIDKTKDILFNNNLVLMQNKFRGKNIELPNNVLDEMNEKTFFDDLKKYYKDNKIELLDSVSRFVSFEDYNAQTFPQYKKGEYHIVGNAVLGKFSLYSSALQKDFRNLIDSKEINVLLDDLLSNVNIEENLNEIIIDGENRIENSAFSEKQIYYINDLNSSQENAIMAMNQNDKLVIQGPPGTGKSQVIASMIADAVNKGQNVLMVSQKKAALDVIYSRLGNLSKFALEINDVKNKEIFYDQMYNLFKSNHNEYFDTSKINSVSNRIDDTMNKFDDIAKVMYEDFVNGTVAYKIYQENSNNLFKKDFNIDKTNYYQVVSEKLININYDDLKSISAVLKNDKILEDCVKNIEIERAYFWLKFMKPQLSMHEKNSMQKDFSEYVENQTEYLKINWFKRLFKSFKQKPYVWSIFKKYFKKKKPYKFLYKNPNVILNGIKEYDNYQNTKPVFDGLTENGKLYTVTLFDLKLLNTSDIQELNDNLFAFIVFCILQDFESRNRETFVNIKDFDFIFNEIVDLISSKKELTKVKLRQSFNESFVNQIQNAKRYGEMLRIIESKRRWSVPKYVKKFSYELFRGVKVWLLTPEVVSEILPLENSLFNLLIFDEASQIYIEKGVPSIARANKVVIAGDHKQLRPSSLGFGRLDYVDDEVTDDDVESEPNAALEEDSLLDLARFKFPEVFLNYHYRAKFEELIAFSNYAFYHGNLNVSPNVLQNVTPPIEVIKIPNGLWKNRANKNEALEVVKLVKKVFKERKSNETIGIIAFNSNQRDMIMDCLDEECEKNAEFSTICKKEYDRMENGEDIGLFVKNIENVQGDERDIIIFSFGYAKNEEGKVIRNFGWLNQVGGENRLNVAISRAKKKIYVITSVEPEQLYDNDLKNDGPKLFRKYLEYCWAVNNRDTASEKRILQSFIQESKINNHDIYDSVIENEVYEKLSAKGLCVEKHAGIGGYELDLVIKDKLTGKYLLGIECDGKLYESVKISRERDVNRKRYFEARGWKIYRIWSSNWWKNPDIEIEKVLQLIK